MLAEIDDKVQRKTDKYQAQINKHYSAMPFKCYSMTFHCICKTCVLSQSIFSFFPLHLLAETQQMHINVKYIEHMLPGVITGMGKEQQQVNALKHFK